MTSQVNTYERLFDNAVEGIFQTLPDGKYLRVNPALARIYGYDSAEELMADLTNIADQLYVDPDRREAFMRKIEQNDVIQDFESRIRNRDGSITWITENARAVRDLCGTLMYYEGFVSDITERKEAEHRQAALESDLHQAHMMTALGHLAGGVAHDFKTLLALVEVLTDQAKAQCVDESTSKIREQLVQIIEVVERGTKVVDRIQRVSQFGKTDSEPVELDRTVSDIIRMLRINLPSGIEIKQQLDLELDPVNANPVAVFQLIMNLFTNVLRNRRATTTEIPVGLRPATTEELASLGLQNIPYLLFTIGKRTPILSHENANPRVSDPDALLATVATLNGALNVHEQDGEACGYTLALPATESVEPGESILERFSSRITSTSGAA